MTSNARLSRTVTKFAIGAVLLAVLGASGASWSQAEGTGMFSVARLKTTSGEEIFQRICQGCHMPDAKGAVGAGKYPALAGDGSLASTDFMALTLLNGRRNMPAFGGNGDIGMFFTVPALTDEQIAAVINYVRSHFGNHFKGEITPAQVKALRQTTPHSSEVHP
jgi:mono/diheme cytochrome c family protein